MSSQFSVLVVDDDEVARKLLKEILDREGYEVTLASSGEEAIECSPPGVLEKYYSVVISDIRMLELDGLDVLKHFKENFPKTVVILMTAFGSMETAVSAIKEGAFDYISKPFKIEDLKNTIQKAFKQAEVLRNVEQRKPTPSQVESVRWMIGSSTKMLEVYKLLARAAMSEATVLISGESGTGKELIAKAIHENSNRRNKKFIAVNCAAVTDSILESELFGHVRGAFTGAQENRKGLFEEASGGTIFLDEIGDITAQMQVKLLRVLQESEVRPVGSNESRKIDVRVITATHHKLSDLVAKGKFREDLYYRLKVLTIDLPALRERKEDIPDLVNHFVAKYSKKNKKSISHLTDQATALLKDYNWPGNVRELENTIEHAIAMASSGQIDVDDFPIEVKNKITASVENVEGVANSLEDLERKHILQVLQKVHYNKSKAADILGIDRATLYRKAQKYKIDLRESKNG
ncbi:MAG: sigma-54-dependent transcriptional regulator [Bacteriovoracia bacterium]